MRVREVHYEQARSQIELKVDFVLICRLPRCRDVMYILHDICALLVLSANMPGSPAQQSVPAVRAGRAAAPRAATHCTSITTTFQTFHQAGPPGGPTLIQTWQPLASQATGTGRRYRCVIAQPFGSTCIDITPEILHSLRSPGYKLKVLTRN